MRAKGKVRDSPAFFAALLIVTNKHRELKITVNSEKIETESANLYQILTEKAVQNQTGIAVALNQNVVPKTAWKTTTIQPNDSILIITATQGG